MSDSSTSDDAQLCSAIFEPLDPGRSEIRLVTVTCNSVGCLRCVLTKHSLDDNPVYFALSYVWGLANDTRPITLNGQRFDSTKNPVETL